MRTIWASSESLPTRSARTNRLPVPLIVPPIAYLAYFIPLSFGLQFAVLKELGLDAVPGVGILDYLGVFVRDLLLAVPRAYFGFGTIVWVPTLAGAMLYATLRLLPPLRNLGAL